ncbi:lysine--tRNA ligase [Candidatus Giovannonibacteria bacterium RIFCSPLOWO2_01_FULL_48_47]|nr:MAG: lysine--tRNA ligase [Candidatus Giovannonibacteria bacterium RIFCSPHIGHO2_02_FULL_48_15]OGF88899.1 MAG: lysine--tRNA ligase [Candidatus Giovannonibacteria bacterium RIFCSPLOWO2_01_FULL_48_47]OGF94660.1 MAG: lysine--tRNA ligase [Candidatus Giovannonibacteria bacterium RIFOXYC1_FULL_48_8]OGF96044.1 MAG: lysine--tRNA ligase [Candidatus Giovannonibacteria bacterium RIFOXYD1_FULL_48_21]HBT81241.1 lysine--tRNA ligase [Candidatus Giovannonibacteria bacterium]
MAFEELRKVRLEKLERLKKAGLNVFPEKAAFPLSEIAGIKKDFRRYARSKKSPGAGGRILAKREHGGSIFADLFDGSGKIQIFFAKDKVGGESFQLFSENIDIGDFISVSGRAFYTKKKEPTLEVSRWQILAKALRPLPEKWHGLSDVEERFRKRYLDLLMNEKVRAKFVLRSKIIQETRIILDKEGYIEVETPILQPLYGGALAEPFKTHHRRLDSDMYLRIAPELYLKRLLVGGFPKVYELGKSFRNEGIDLTHNPEFTTIELYEAYRDAEYLKDFIGRVLYALIKKVIKKDSFEFNGHKIKFLKKIPSITFWQVLERHALITHPEKLSQDDFRLRAKQFGLNPDSQDNKAKIANEIFSKICRPKLIQPVFVVNHPIEISPLAKNLSENQKLVDRFQLIIGGIELVNGFSELNDPQEQRVRFEMQEDLRKKEDREAHPMDEEFIEALEYGMPPAAGLAVSIDRLSMLLTDTSNIKEVILFPILKPKE